MTIKELIEELKQKEIEINFTGGKLKYSGPEENISSELIRNLKEYKGKLIKYFWPKELSNLMPINTEGSKPPIFIVHGDQSNYLISDHLGQDQPVYGFFHPGSEGKGIKYRNVEEMAKTYLDMILEVYPSGPFFLIGFSFGGILAYEIAVELQRSGYEVPFLVIIDTVSPLAREPVKWRYNVFNSIRLNILRPVRRKLKRIVYLMICNSYLFVNKPIPFKRRNYYLWIRYLTMHSKYLPRKFDGNLLLFKATATKSSFKYLGWETLVNEIRDVEIDGKHLELFSVKDRAKILQTEIEKYLIEVS